LLDQPDGVISHSIMLAQSTSPNEPVLGVPEKQSESPIEPRAEAGVIFEPPLHAELRLKEKGRMEKSRWQRGATKTVEKFECKCIYALSSPPSFRNCASRRLYGLFVLYILKNAASA